MLEVCNNPESRNSRTRTSNHRLQTNDNIVVYRTPEPRNGHTRGSLHRLFINEDIFAQLNLLKRNDPTHNNKIKTQFARLVFFFIQNPPNEVAGSGYFGSTGIYIPTAARVSANANKYMLLLFRDDAFTPLELELDLTCDLDTTYPPSLQKYQVTLDSKAQISVSLPSNGALIPLPSSFNMGNIPALFKNSLEEHSRALKIEARKLLFSTALVLPEMPAAIPPLKITAQNCDEYAEQIDSRLELENGCLRALLTYAQRKREIIQTSLAAETKMLGTSLATIAAPLMSLYSIETRAILGRQLEISYQEGQEEFARLSALLNSRTNEETEKLANIPTEADVLRTHLEHIDYGNRIATVIYIKQRLIRCLYETAKECLIYIWADQREDRKETDRINSKFRDIMKLNEIFHKIFSFSIETGEASTLEQAYLSADMRLSQLTNFIHTMATKCKEVAFNPLKRLHTNLTALSTELANPTELGLTIFTVALAFLNDELQFTFITKGKNTAQEIFEKTEADYATRKEFLSRPHIHATPPALLTDVSNAITIFKTKTERDVKHLHDCLATVERMKDAQAKQERLKPKGTYALQLCLDIKSIFDGIVNEDGLGTHRQQTLRHLNETLNESCASQDDIADICQQIHFSFDRAADNIHPLLQAAEKLKDSVAVKIYRAESIFNAFKSKGSVSPQDLALLSNTEKEIDAAINELEQRLTQTKQHTAFTTALDQASDHQIWVASEQEKVEKCLSTAKKAINLADNPNQHELLTQDFAQERINLFIAAETAINQFRVALTDRKESLEALKIPLKLMRAIINYGEVCFEPYEAMLAEIPKLINSFQRAIICHLLAGSILNSEYWNSVLKKSGRLSSFGGTPVKNASRLSLSMSTPPSIERISSFINTPTQSSPINSFVGSPIQGDHDLDETIDVPESIATLLAIIVHPSRQGWTSDNEKAEDLLNAIIRFASDEKNLPSGKMTQTLFKMIICFRDKSHTSSTSRQLLPAYTAPQARSWTTPSDEIERFRTAIMQSHPPAEHKPIQDLVLSTISLRTMTRRDSFDEPQSSPYDANIESYIAPSIRRFAQQTIPTTAADTHIKAAPNKRPLLARAFLATFHKDYYPQENTYSGLGFKLNAEAIKRLWENSQMVATFFGLDTINRSEVLAGETEPTQREIILHNLFGWQRNATGLKRLFNLVKIASGIIPIINIFLLVASFALNIFRLVTEFLPKTLELVFGELSHTFHALARNRQKPFYVRAGYYFLRGCCLFLHGAFRVTAFVGRAITSPIDGARHAYKEGRRLGNTPLGLVFAIASTVLSITAAIIFWPLAIKAFVGSLPTIATKASVTLGKIVQAFKPVGALFEKVLLALRVPIPSLGAVGMSFIASVSMVTLGSFIDSRAKQVAANWRKSPTPAAETAPATPVSSPKPNMGLSSSAQVLRLANSSSSTPLLASTGTHNYQSLDTRPTGNATANPLAIPAASAATTRFLVARSPAVPRRGQATDATQIAPAADSRIPSPP